MITIRTQELLDRSSIHACVLALREGGILLYPTETFYAFGIDPRNATAMQGLFDLKSRAQEKRLPVIAADAAMVALHCDITNPWFQKLADRFWPGPLTLVLPLLDSPNSCAVRVSSHPIARQLSLGLNGFVVSTSANQSGEPALADPQNLPQEFRDRVRILIDAGPCNAGLPSTILSLIEDPPKILREGAISTDEILLVL